MRTQNRPFYRVSCVLITLILHANVCPKTSLGSIYCIQRWGFCECACCVCVRMMTVHGHVGVQL